VNVVIRSAATAADRLASWRLRELVFIGEQGISEDVERDGLDDLAWHLVAWDGEEPVGTARVLGLDAEHRLVRPEQAAVAKIGRMAVLPTKRRLGIGRQLLDAALELARRHGIARAELSAQEYVVPFYERAGFRAEGERYEEAGIPHRRMSCSLLSG
jgi:predicted GNAT family N-acyltransferase